MTRLVLGISAGLAGLLLSGTAFSADLPGKFPGVTIDVKLISDAPIGSAVAIEVMRNGKRQTIKVPIERQGQRVIRPRAR